MKRSESNPSTSTSQYADAGNKKPETFKEIMGFSGWAPEVINCRAGMIAFVAAMGAEMQSHETFFAQFHDHVFSLVFASLLITVASFMPSMQNADDYTEAVVKAVRDFHARGGVNQRQSGYRWFVNGYDCRENNGARLLRVNVVRTRFFIF